MWVRVSGFISTMLILGIYMRLQSPYTRYRKYGVDRVFLVLILILLAFGLLMVYEASSFYSSREFGNKYHFLYLQSFWFVIGLAGMYLLSKIKLERIREIAPILFLAMIIILVFTLLPTPFAPAVYGARRWLVLNPSPLPAIPFIGRISFQPSELAKLVSIIFFASFLSMPRRNIQTKFHIVRSFALLVLLIVGLIFVEPDFTTAFVLVGILTGMFFLANGELVYFIIGGPLIAIATAIYAFSSEYRRARIQTLLNPDSMDKMGAGYHIRQIMIALGSGGIWGLGLGKSRQKFAYLPEVTADSIFAIIGEEFGFIGTTFVVIIFALLILRGLKIAQKALGLFESLLCTGVIMWIIIQVLINLGAMARLLPLTGVPLPLISYGGSSTIFILWGLGLVLNVSRLKN